MKFLVGLLFGIFAGFIIAAVAQLSIEKNAVENKTIKLNGEYYEIKEITKS